MIDIYRYLNDRSQFDWLLFNYKAKSDFLRLKLLQISYKHFISVLLIKELSWNFNSKYNEFQQALLSIFQWLSAFQNKKKYLINSETFCEISPKYSGSNESQRWRALAHMWLQHPTYQSANEKTVVEFLRRSNIHASVIQRRKSGRKNIFISGFLNIFMGFFNEL